MHFCIGARQSKSPCTSIFLNFLKVHRIDLFTWRERLTKTVGGLFLKVKFMAFYYWLTVELEDVPIKPPMSHLPSSLYPTSLPRHRLGPMPQDSHICFVIFSEHKCFRFWSSF